MSIYNNSSGARREQLRISSHPLAGWAVSDQPPSVGSVVVSVDGYAEVMRVLGRLTDGSRLLELKFLGEKRPPYFAATSNVLQRVSVPD
jgi:hypothetical protein